MVKISNKEVIIGKEEIFSALPPEWNENLFSKIQSKILSNNRKIVVLDDDPTGTQTVHGVPILTRWSQQNELEEVMQSENPLFYILTNSRSYNKKEAIDLTREIALNLSIVSKKLKREIVIISRSDSTLRGHYPEEINILQEVLEQQLNIRYCGHLLVPFFEEGGRYTINDIHWVQKNEMLIPSSQTEFARDPFFGYHHSNLREWVLEKSNNHILSSSIYSITINDLRLGGPNRVAHILRNVSNKATVIVNSASYKDIEVVVFALLQLADEGKNFLFRSAASFVRIMGGISKKDLLSIDDLFTINKSSKQYGLILVGSYIQKTTEQLNEALKLSGILSVELNVSRILSQKQKKLEINRLTRFIEEGLFQKKNVIVYTSRKLYMNKNEFSRKETIQNESSLTVNKHVSNALVEVVVNLKVKPQYVVAKGGITSSDIGTRALGIIRPMVAGQILPGIPVWILGKESKFPGIPYIVFPGNVGSSLDLARVIEILSGENET